MLFPTFKFFVFFCLVFAVYWSLPTLLRWLPWGSRFNPTRLRLGWLLIASGYFYMSWNPWLILLILFSASVDYAVALLLQQVTTVWKRRTLLILSISTNLGCWRSSSTRTSLSERRPVPQPASGSPTIRSC